MIGIVTADDLIAQLAKRLSDIASIPEVGIEKEATSYAQAEG